MAVPFCDITCTLTERSVSSCPTTERVRLAFPIASITVASVWEKLTPTAVWKGKRTQGCKKTSSNYRMIRCRYINLSLSKIFECNATCPGDINFGRRIHGSYRGRLLWQVGIPRNWIIRKVKRKVEDGGWCPLGSNHDKHYQVKITFTKVDMDKKIHMKVHIFWNVR